MTRFRFLLRLCSVACMFSMVDAALGAETAPQLNRVILNQGGVAYYELTAVPSADRVVTLDVPRDQMDDVLKSLTVLDAKTRIAEATVAGEAPVSAAFGALPFKQHDFDSLPALLRSLTGEEVTLTADRVIAGRLVAVDPVGKDDKTAAVTLRASGGLVRVPLSSVRSVSLADKALDTAMDKALDAFQDGRGTGGERLHITLAGTVGKQVSLAYVARAPVWKSVYRLTLDGSEGRLEGWAVLENFSGRDWKGVNLTLSSGNPVTFHQALYRAYYVDRPEVPVELFEQITPPADKGVMKERAAAPTMSGMMATYKAEASPTGAPPSPQVQESATEILIDLGKVSLANGQSLTLPITRGDAPVRAVTYLPMYDERPLAAFEITNRGKTSLPPGVVTVYRSTGNDARYLGDSRLGVVPVGEERLLSYAGDFKVKADRHRASSSVISRATIADGVMTVVEVVYHDEAIDIALPRGEARTVVADFGAAGNWKPVAPKNGIRKINNGYRVTQSFGKGDKGKIEARFADERLRRVTLLETEPSVLLDYVTRGSFRGEMKAAIDRVVALKREESAAKRARDQARDELDLARQAEERARENLKAVGDVPLRQQYLEKLVKAEAATDKAKAGYTKAEAAARSAEDALRDFIKTLNIKS